MAVFDFEVKKGDEVVRHGSVREENRESAKAFVENMLEQRHYAKTHPEETIEKTGAEFPGVAHDPKDLKISLKEAKRNG